MYPNNIESFEIPYIADQLDYDAIRPDRYRWVGGAALIFAIMAPFSLFVLVSQEHLATCLLAYLNIIIILTATWRFVRKHTLAALIPVLFMPYLLLAWPVATLYFAIFLPNQAYYLTFAGSHSMFEAGVRLQLCTLLFLIAYLSIMSWALRNESSAESIEWTPSKGFGYIIGIITSGVIFFDALHRVVSLPKFIEYLAAGFYKYLNGLVFIVGAWLKRFPFVIKLIILALVTTVVLFYTVGNARARAVRCVAFLALGLIFLGEYSRRTKLIIAISLFLAFPLYATVANTTREILGTIGFEEGFKYRLKVLGEWRQVTAERSATAFTFGRLFFQGGHAIISRTPEELPYRAFKPYPFIRETFESLIPGVIYFRPYYRGPQILIDYGCFVIPGVTSIEVSMVGALWLMGGYAPVFLGGIGLGLLHWLLIKILQRTRSVSELKTLVYFSTLAPGIFWASNFAIIEHWRDTVYRLLMATVIYLFLKPFTAHRELDVSGI